MLIELIIAQTSFGSGHGHHEKIEGRIKVTEKMYVIQMLKLDSLSSVWINVVPPDGVPRRIAGFSGESLLDVIQRNNIPGIFRK